MFVDIVYGPCFFKEWENRPVELKQFEVLSLQFERIVTYQSLMIKELMALVNSRRSKARDAGATSQEGDGGQNTSDEQAGAPSDDVKNGDGENGNGVKAEPNDAAEGDEVMKDGESAGVKKVGFFGPKHLFFPSKSSGNKLHRYTSINRCGNIRLPLFSSFVTISNPDSLSSSETGFNPGKTS
jgi:hypothetical protein